MKLDMVHDIQSVYRKVLNAMSRPGVLENISEEAEKNDININFYGGSFLVMLMILDREVSFNVVSEQGNDVSKLISEITYAQVKPVEESDYIFVLEDKTVEILDEVIEKCKIGNLVDPQKSATIIAEVKCISKDGDIALEGPGIQDVNKISICGDKKWISARKNKNEEYPLGVELIFVDENSNLVCIPRTTKIIDK